MDTKLSLNKKLASAVRNSKLQNIKAPSSIDSRRISRRDSGSKKSEPEISAQADPIGTAKVTANALNVREGAGTNYARIGGLTKGKEVQVYEENNGWLKIAYGTGYGWISKTYTDYKTPEPGYETWKGYVTADSLRVRDIPGNGGTPASGSQILGNLTNGTVVEVLGEQNGWYKINYQGKEAWICGDYVSKYSEPDPDNRPGYPTIATWNIQPIYNFFKDQVFGSHAAKKAIACGFLGNIYVESKYQPDAEQKKGAAHTLAKGIIQWDGSRREELYTYCGGTYESRQWVNLQKQLDFAKHELQSSESSARKSVENGVTSNSAAQARTAAHIIAQKFERCANPDNPLRQDKAEEHFNSL